MASHVPASVLRNISTSSGTTRWIPLSVVVTMIALGCFMSVVYMTTGLLSTRGCCDPGMGWGWTKGKTLPLYGGEFPSPISGDGFSDHLVQVEVEAVARVVHATSTDQRVSLVTLANAGVPERVLVQHVVRLVRRVLQIGDCVATHGITVPDVHEAVGARRPLLEGTLHVLLRLGEQARHDVPERVLLDRDREEAVHVLLQCLGRLETDTEGLTSVQHATAHGGRVANLVRSQSVVPNAREHVLAG